MVKNSYIFILIMIFSQSVLATDWPPNDYNFRPQPPNNTRSIAPSDYPLEPYNYGSFQPRRLPPPQFAVESSNNHPYVRENIILTLRVISTDSIERMDTVLPQTQNVTFQVLHDPIAITSFDNGRSQIINEIRYMVTPLRTGTTTLQFSVNVTVTGYGQQNTVFTLPAPQAITLEVQPQVPNVNPWLPLEQLAITSNLETSPQVEAGESVDLVLKLTAAGTLGNQLPSLEKLLKSPDFRVYRGKTASEGGPSEDFRHIMGSRTEHYTLVPQNSGSLLLPPIQVLWFNTRTGAAERSTLSINNLNVESSDTVSNLFLTSIFWLILFILFVVFSALMLRWINLPSLRFVLSKTTVSLVNSIKVWRIGQRLNLRWYWYRSLNTLANALPLSIRFWFWVRCANVERIPTLWRKTLQFLSWRALTNSPYITCQHMAELIIRFNPYVKPEELKRLLKTLDGATYGNQAIDFEMWKQDFARQIRPGPLSLLHKLYKHNQHQSHLLPLNPEHHGY